MLHERYEVRRFNHCTHGIYDTKTKSWSLFGDPVKLKQQVRKLNESEKQQ